MVQLSRLVKSSILTLNISNFGIVYFKRYISKICEKRFRFIDTLKASYLGNAINKFHDNEFNVKFIVYTTNWTIFSKP